MAAAIKFLDPMSHFISKVLDGEEVEKIVKIVVH